MPLTIYCIHCDDHRFLINIETLSTVGILTLLCPECREATSMGLDGGGRLTVIPGHPRPAEDG